MKRLSLILPLLALAAAPARAEDPATNAPALPAWFGGIRIGMSTNELFALVPDASEDPDAFQEEPRPDETVFSVEPDDATFGRGWIFVFKDGRLVLAGAEDDADEDLRASVLSGWRARFGEPDESAPFFLSAFLDGGGAIVRTAWTNGAALVAVVASEGPAPDSLNLFLSDRAYAAAGPEWTPLFFYGLVPADLPGEFVERFRRFAPVGVRAFRERGENERARDLARFAHGVLARAAEKAAGEDDRKRLAAEAERFRLQALECEERLLDPASIDIRDAVRLVREHSDFLSSETLRVSSIRAGEGAGAPFWTVVCESAVPRPRPADENGDSDKVDDPGADFAAVTLRVDAGGVRELSRTPVEAGTLPLVWAPDLVRYCEAAEIPLGSVAGFEGSSDTNFAGTVMLADGPVRVPADALARAEQARFFDAIAGADRIVIRDGGFDCCTKDVDRQRILATVDDPAEVKAFAAMVRFTGEHGFGQCLCCGFPGIDWWKGDRKLALTSVQHGEGLRWSGFSDDYRFTPESAAALAAWFRSRGLPFDCDAPAAPAASESHAESAENAESEPHAESAEGAE